MLYIYLPVLYYHGNLYTEGAYAGGRGSPLSQQSFLFWLDIPLQREGLLCKIF